MSRTPGMHAPLNVPFEDAIKRIASNIETEQRDGFTYRRFTVSPGDDVDAILARYREEGWEYVSKLQLSGRPLGPGPIRVEFKKKKD